MSRYKIILLLLLLTSIPCKSRGFEKVILNNSDTSNLYISDGESTELYYLKLISKGGFEGTIVISPSGV